jgi:anti-sigma factor RsiW
MMVNHKPYLDWMQLALDEALAPAQRSELEAHLADCAACAEHWGALIHVAQLLATEPPAAPRAGFTGRFKARLAQRHSRPKEVWGAFALGLGAIGASALVLPIGLGLLWTLVQIVGQPAATAALFNGANVTANMVKVVLEALVILTRSIIVWAVSNPLIWASGISSVALTGVWFYMMRKLNREVSLR